MNTSIVLRPATLADVPVLERWDWEVQVISATTDDPAAEKAFEDAYWPRGLYGNRLRRVVPRAEAAR